MINDFNVKKALAFELIPEGLRPRNGYGQENLSKGVTRSYLHFRKIDFIQTLSSS